MKDVTHLIELLLISLMTDISKKEILLDEWFDKYNPTSDAYSIRASISKSKRNFDRAIINFDKSLALNDNNAYALNNYGYMLMGLDQDPEKAKKLFAKAIKIIPNFTEARLNLGCLLSHKFNDDISAREQYQEIIKYNPTEAKVYNNLANIEIRNAVKSNTINNKVTAKVVCELYEKSLELNPNYIEAHLGYGNYLAEFMSDFCAAEKHFKKITELDANAKCLVETLLERVDSLRKLNKK